MSEDLARVIAVAIDGARRLDEERIRAIVDEQLEKRLGTGRDTAARDWLSKPKAAKAAGITVKRLRKLIKAGLVETRPYDRSKPAGRIEVFVPSIREALEGKAPTPPTDAAAWARARLARGGK